MADNDDKTSPLASAGPTILPAINYLVEEAQSPAEVVAIDSRVIWVCGLAIVIGIAGSLVSQLFVNLIAFITNLAFFGRISLKSISPGDNHLGWLVLLVPIVGGFICGLMARYGSKAIRGHGIPEAMETVLTNRSRIPARITFLKPVASAVAIGTGGPFGAEGPIIATGGALGSLFGQFFRITPAERRTLLACGAAAGMSAIFGSPVAAVLLAIELLLFEFRPRSIIPVALASATADGLRLVFQGPMPVFPMPDVAAPIISAMVFYIFLGAVMGIAAALITRLVYFTEDAFEKLPIHWMWWPLIGGAVVGICGYFVPRTLGVGYENISAVLSNDWAVSTVAILGVVKLISWTIAIGSGTSGGTMAPLFTIGGAMGQVVGALAAAIVPAAGIDLKVAGLVGMAAMFAGASRAFLACTVFAFEATEQPFSLLPLLGGCAASYLAATLIMKNSLMTEKIVRRGVATTHEYTADLLAQVTVRDVATKKVVTLSATQTVGDVRNWFESGKPEARHQGFPVLDGHGVLVGVLTRRDLLNPEIHGNKQLKDLPPRLPKFVYEECTVRQAVDHMVRHDIGRLPVMTRGKPPKLVGMVTRTDILSAFKRGLDESTTEAPTLKIPGLRRRKKSSRTA